MKLFLFWLWLWQWKEYHFGRVKAYFETRLTEKFIASFLRIRLPKFTQKATAVSLAGLILGLAIGWTNNCWFLLASLLFSPLIASLAVIFFQIPTAVWRSRVIARAKKKRAGFKDLLVIGITGSYGKTSTKEMLYQLLAIKFNVLKTQEHQNSEIGIARTVLNYLKPEHEVFIVEMGAYNRGGIRMLCDIVKPKIGALTGINEQHMSTFGSQENIIKAKFELLESLPNNGTAIVNYDNSLISENLKTKSAKLHCKIQSYSLRNTPLAELPQDFSAFDKQNILAALTVAKELGLTEDEISAGLKKIKPSLLPRRGFNNLNIIDSSYSSNPASVMSHLEYLKKWSGRRVVVMPYIRELGKASAAVHQRIGEKIVEVCDLAIIVTKDRFKEIKDKGGDKTIFMSDPAEIMNKLEAFDKPDDIILLEGRVPKKLIDLLNVPIF